MLKIYNTLTRKTEEFKTIEDGKVKMYVCGPTVYSDIHLGNARPIIFFDMLKTYLTYLGYDVDYVSNITDLDDKIIDKAKELNVNEDIIADRYTNEYFKVLKLLGSKYPDLMPKATDYVDQMILYIDDLIKKGYAYQTKSGVYFKVSKIEEYGNLSNQTLEKLEENTRFENSEDKIDAKDFVLWKNTEDGKNFDSLFGKGRPGWHTECAVMNHDIFNSKIDIHGGGSDLKFPHHENEIAQTIAHDNHSLANYWMHVGRLDFDNVKMSKSLGNIINVKDLVKKYHRMAFRLLILGHHYRQPIKYQETIMDEYQRFYEKIRKTMMKTALELPIIKNNTYNEAIMDLFNKQMKNDLSTPNVITIIQDLLKLIAKEDNLYQKESLYNTLDKILAILGIELEFELTKSIKDTYYLWQQARGEKDYQKADELRNILASEGWI